jgi:T-complex protein 1 subunit gamma
MRRRIENPRILLLDSPLEYKKGESMLNEEMSKESDFKDIMEQERKEMRYICDHIIKFKPDIVVTEKGVSDFAAHYLYKGGCSVIRRLRKTDNNRLAKVSGATICNRTEEIQESDIGTKAYLRLRRLVMSTSHTSLTVLILKPALSYLEEQARMS